MTETIHSIQRALFTNTILEHIGGHGSKVELYHDEEWDVIMFRATAMSKGTLLNVLRYLEIEIQLMQCQVEEMKDA